VERSKKTKDRVRFDGELADCKDGEEVEGSHLAREVWGYREERTVEGLKRVEEGFRVKERLGCCSFSSCETGNNE
jgi:hypothetical protein